MTEETAAPEGEGQVAEAAPAPEGQAPAEAPAETTWFDGADDDTKGFILNKGWDKDPLAAINSYRELEKMRGAPADKFLKLPDDPEAEGAFDEIYDKLGRPEKPDDYQLDLGEDVPLDPARVGAMAEVAHKIGLNNQQLQALAQADAQYQLQFMEEMNRQQEVELAQLKSEWGQHYAEREELARRAVRQALPEGADKESLLNAIEQSIGTANMLKMFANMAKTESMLPSDSGDRPFGYTREQAINDKQTLMEELKGDPARLKAYNEGKGPDYAKMQQLEKLIAPRVQ